jgi:hypothetical protein
LPSAIGVEVAGWLRGGVKACRIWSAVSVGAVSGALLRFQKNQIAPPITAKPIMAQIIVIIRLLPEFGASDIRTL